MISIPPVIALDFDYNLSKEDLEKTINLKLEINQEMFKKINEDRKSNNQPEIELNEIHKLVIKGKVSYQNETSNFRYVLNPSDEEKDLAKIIEPILEIKIEYFSNKKTELLHFCPKFNQLMIQKNYNEIENSYFRPLKQNEIKNDVGLKNYETLAEPNSKFNVIFKTLINQPLKQVSEIFLPTLANNEESVFFNEVDDGNYKYLTFIPENYFWDLPRNMQGEVIKTKKVKITLRYLKIDEIYSSTDYLLSDDQYITNLGKEIYSEEISLNEETPYEVDWSTESLKQNNGLVQSNRLPRFTLDKDDNITLTQAGKVNDFLLRLYFGVNSKFFDEKLSISPDVELELK